MVFQDAGLNDSFKKSCDKNEVDVFFKQVSSSYRPSDLSPTDELSLNMLKSYNLYLQNELYEALKFNLLNEKSFNPAGNEKLILANRLLSALIYEKKGVLPASAEILGNIYSKKESEFFQIRFYLGSLQKRIADYNNAFSTFKSILPVAQKSSVVDYFFTLINLSEVSNKTGNHETQLQYALIADSLIIKHKNIVFSNDIDYDITLSGRSNIIDELKAHSLINLAVAYRKNGKYKLSVEIIDSFLESSENVKDDTLTCSAYINKALAYTLAGEYNNAEFNYLEAFKIAEKDKNPIKKSEILNLLSKNSYLAQNLDKAIGFCESSILISEKSKDYQNLAASYLILSETYAINNNVIDAQAYYRLYDEIRDIIKNSYQTKHESELNRSNELKLLIEKAETELVELEKKELEIVNIEILAQQKEREFLMLKKDNELKEKDLLNQNLEKERIQHNLLLIEEQLRNEQLVNQNIIINREREIKNLESKRNEDEIKLLNAQKEIYIRENDLKTQALNSGKIRQILLSIVLLIMFGFLSSLIFFIIKLKRQKRLIEEFNTTINHTNEKLEQNIRLITEQNKLIELKNEQIINSINYSQRIQNSFIFSQDDLGNLFRESFVVFLPKEIVSGDFYLVKRKGDMVYLAVVDCTGHGVPGSIISAIAFQEISHLIDMTNLNTGNLLDLLNVRMNNLLNTTDSIGSDGMDLALLSINSKNKVIQYSGAKSNFIFHSDNQWIDFKTDCQSIGQELREKSFTFSTNNFEFNDGDLIYLYTDGLADQICFPDNKRIGTKRFKDFIKEKSDLELNIQKAEIEDFLMSNKKENDQTDDITLIGIKF